MTHDVIYLDMDGVVVDLARSFLRVFGKEHLLDEDPGPLNEHMANVLGMGEETFWKCIDEAGISVWSDAPEYPWSRDLYEQMQLLADEVVFLSSPSWDPQSLAGKLAWLQKFTGQRNFRDYIFTAKKNLLACKGALLVDDRESNILEFEAEGGDVVLFPQPWNSVTLVQDCPEIDYVVQQIMELQHE